MSFNECGCETAWIAPSILDNCSGSQYVSFMTIIDFIIRYACQISDPCGRVVAKTQPDDTYDFIVIGSGSAGSTIAGRLAEIPEYKTLLLEAGMDEPPATQVPFVPPFYDTAIDWNYTTQPENNACLGTGGVCPWHRAKVLGGNSATNGMMYMRGTKADFQRWVDAGNDGWSFDDLLPIFKKSEDNTQIDSVASPDYHGTGGPFTIQQFNYAPPLAHDLLIAATQVGFNLSSDLNGEDITGFTLAQAHNRNGTRLSTAKAFVRPHKDNPNFHVMINSTVTKILIDDSGENKTATGVEFIYNNKTYIVNVTKEVILAAGTTNTPQILLLSGIGDESVLQPVGIEQVHDLKGVGKGMINHVAITLPAEVDDEFNLVDLNYENLDEYLATRDGILSSSGLRQITARLASNYTTPDDPDIQLIFGGYSNICAYDGNPGSPVDPNNPTDKRKISIEASNLQPKSKGSISLLTKDPLSPPKIVGNYLDDPDDAKIIIAGIRIIQKLLKAQILVEKYNLTIPKSDYGDCATKYEYDSDEYWECAISYDTNPETHQCCSCKMGPESNPESCVNSKLELHGIPNIRIADAAAMPLITSANVEATIIAVAERAAINIIEKYPVSNM